MPIIRIIRMIEMKRISSKTCTRGRWKDDRNTTENNVDRDGKDDERSNNE